MFLDYGNMIFIFFKSSFFLDSISVIFPVFVVVSMFMILREVISK